MADIGKHVDKAYEGMDFTELAGTTGLLLVAILRSSFTRDPLSIGDLRLLGIQANLEFSLGTVDGDINVLIAHTLQNRLVRDVIVVPGEGHILFTQAGERR